MEKLFGTDGIRGKAGLYPLDLGTVARIGAAFAVIFDSRLGRPPRFISGRDTRESGSGIESAFHKGAMSRSAIGESAGVITTPGVAFLTKEFGYDAGIVISASHNPFDDNGLKIFLPSGRKLDDAAERQIEEMTDLISEPEKSADLDPIESRADQFRRAYLGMLKDNFAGIDLRGIKIVADCANGAASTFAPYLFEDLGARVVVINAKPNGRNINENCGSLHLEQLSRSVVHERADLGVAFDGDADRALFVDDRGNVVDGDATLWILAHHMDSQGELVSRKVVATVMSNIGLEKALNGIGIELIRTSVGDKYVLDELMKSGAEIGGEQSGHIIVPKRSLVGDGMATALSILKVLESSSRTLSELQSGLDKFPQILVNVRVRTKRPFTDVKEIVETVERVERQLGNEGRLLLRYSGTEDLARVMIEGRNLTDIEELTSSLVNAIERNLG